MAFGLEFDLKGREGTGLVFDILHPGRGPWMFKADDTGFVSLPAVTELDWYYVGVFFSPNETTAFPYDHHWIYYEVEDTEIAGKIRAHGDGAPLWFRVYHEGWNWAAINPLRPDMHPQASSTWSMTRAGQLVAPLHGNSTVDVPLVWSVYDPHITVPLEGSTCLGEDGPRHGFPQRAGQ